MVQKVPSLVVGNSDCALWRTLTLCLSLLFLEHHCSSMWLCHWFWHDICVLIAPCRATCDSAAVTLPCSVPLHETRLDPCHHSIEQHHYNTSKTWCKFCCVWAIKTCVHSQSKFSVSIAHFLWIPFMGCLNWDAHWKSLERGTTSWRNRTLTLHTLCYSLLQVDFSKTFYWLEGPRSWMRHAILCQNPSFRGETFHEIVREI